MWQEMESRILLLKDQKRNISSCGAQLSRCHLWQNFGNVLWSCFPVFSQGISKGEKWVEMERRKSTNNSWNCCFKRGKKSHNLSCLGFSTALSLLPTILLWGVNFKWKKISIWGISPSLFRLWCLSQWHKHILMPFCSWGKRIPLGTGNYCLLVSQSCLGWEGAAPKSPSVKHPIPELDEGITSGLG